MELYAGTEAQAATIITGTEWLAHRGSVGKVAFGEMAAFDADGNRLPPGEIGEVYMRRPTDMPAVLPLPRRQRAHAAGRLGEPGRHRLVRRGRLSLSRRPAHRHDPGRRLQRLSGRDRGGAGRASAGAVERGDRPAGRGDGQTWCTPSCSRATGLTEDGAARAPARPAGHLQAAAHLRVRHREHPRRRRQGAPHPAARRTDRADEGDRWRLAALPIRPPRTPSSPRG